MEYIQILFPTILFLFISFLWKYYTRSSSSTLPINFPIIGNFPSVIFQLHRILDYSAEGLQQTQGTFLLNGPWFSKLELLITADPKNVHYIMCKQHQHFNRGANYQEKIDILGDGVLIAESDNWQYQRKIAISTFNTTRFRQSMISILQHKLDNGLIPFFHISNKEDRVVNLQDIFYRLISDITVKILIGIDPNYLSFDQTPALSYELMSSHDAEDAPLERYVYPEFIWKLKRRFGIGKEGQHTKFKHAIYEFADEMVRKKREESESESKPDDLMSLYIEEKYGEHGFISTDVFLRDTFVNFLLAGKDTVSPALSWMFWLLIKHPRVVSKIREELAREECEVSELGNSDNLVYLHASVYEALRLYPSVPNVVRAAEKGETLPSGHRVNPWTMIILCTYAMGRMKWVWGEDCEEFRPERWMTEKGELKHEPSHKFFVFNSGHKVCIEKEIAMIQMKAVVRCVITSGYWFEVVRGHQVEPASSVTLWMKHGLKVKVIKSVHDLIDPS